MGKEGLELKVVILGSSAAALSAAEEFRRHDEQSDVTLISPEEGLPYSKVLLPYVLRGKIPYQGLTIRESDYFTRLNLRYVQGEAARLEEAEHRLILKDGTVCSYDKLLIATGARASTPNIPGIQDSRVCYMRTKEDLDHMMPLLHPGARVAVIGSGFVALQAAWAARFRGLPVTVLGHRIMPSAMDEAGAEVVAQAIRDSGVELLAPVHTKSIEPGPDGGLRICLEEGLWVDADVILVGAGVKPNTEFLAGSGILVEKGIPVNGKMQTSHPDVYAAGDVAAGPTVFGEEHVLHSLWPTAVEMGRVAGGQMAGVDLPYDGSLNMNVTQMFHVTVASVGKFRQQDVDECVVLPEELGYGRLCVFGKDGVLCGATLIGGSEGVSFLGKLRPLIARHQPMTRHPQELGDYVNKQVFARNWEEGQPG
ncbi:NAD(P)/FAD-dependent oxidoreductase [Pseudoflavonifractor sp. AF19-9AC]|nr:NAD(P)/FAD-dependent oxidoreductase [Pseudoflavonifractor sp. AF19-9AC]